MSEIVPFLKPIGSQSVWDIKKVEFYGYSKFVEKWSQK
jgi:hypothetical protein